MQHAVEDDSENRKEERRARHQVHIGMLVVPRPRRRALAVAQDGLLYDISCRVVGASVLILGRDGKEAGGRGGHVFACLLNSTNEKSLRLRVQFSKDPVEKKKALDEVVSVG